MKKAKYLFALSASGLLLAACGGQQSSSTSGSQTSSSSESSTSSSTGTITSKPTPSFDKALQKDYSNMTVEVYQQYQDGEMTETDYEYYDGSYITDYSYDMAAQGYPSEYCYTHYHIDDAGESWTYWAADKTVEGSKGGWLQTGYDKADLSIWKTYFYAPLFLKNITAADVALSQGMYFVKSQSKIEELNMGAFGFAWFNDIIDIGIVLNDDGYIWKIYGFCDEEEKSEEESNIVLITFNYFGTTEIPYADTIPSFSEETKTTYWQYKGWPHDYAPAWYTDVDAKVTDGQTLPSDADHDVVLEIDKKFEIEAVLTPEKFQPWDWVSEEDSKVSWHYDDKVVKLSYATATNHMTVQTIGAGETEIYATVNGEHGTLTSKKIKVKVTPAKEQDMTNAVYHFDFLMIEDSGNVIAANSIDTAAPYTIAAGPCVDILDGKKSELFDNDGLYPVIDAGKQDKMHSDKKPGLYFDFDDQQVAKLSFKYGWFYAAHASNINHLTSFKVRTSNDGITWNEQELVDVVKTNISKEFEKLLEVEFAPASMVEIVVDTDIVGAQVAIGLDSIVFNKNDECHDHEDPSPVVPVSSITVAPASLDMYIGDTSTLHYLINPNNATNKTLTWHVEEGKEGVVSVSAEGVVTALGAGTAEVWATAANGVASNRVTVKVSEKPSLNDKVGNVYASEYIECEIIDSETAKVTYGEHVVTATLDDFQDDKYLLSNENGEGFGLEFKNSTVFVTNIKYLENGEIKTPSRTSWDAELQIYMTSFALKVGDLRPNEEGKYDVKVGDITTLILTSITPSDANVKSVTYVNGDPTKATVDEDTGAVTFKAAGEVTITVKSAHDPSIAKSVTFVITEKVYPTEDNWEIVAPTTEVDVTGTIQFSIKWDASVESGKSVEWSVENASGTNATIGKTTGKFSAGTVAGTVTVKATATAKDGTKIVKSVVVTIKDSGSVVPAKIVGTWTGMNENGSEFTFTVNSDGTAIYECEDDGYTYECTFVGERVQANIYDFTLDEDEATCFQLDVRNSTATLTLNDNDSYEYYFVGLMYGVDVEKA